MTGHSKKIANAIAAELNTYSEDVRLKPQIESTDLLFIVGGIYSGESLGEMTDFVKDLDTTKVKTAALVTSSARNKYGQNKVRATLEENGIKVLDEYRCIGNFLIYKMGHPNKEEIAGAVKFAKEIAKRNS